MIVRGIYFEKHKSSVKDDALGCEEGGGDGDAAEGLDGVEVELCANISLRSSIIVLYSYGAYFLDLHDRFEVAP